MSARSSPDYYTSFTTRLLKCWDPDEQENWIREKDPVSIKENTYGTDRLGELSAAIFGEEYAGGHGVNLPCCEVAASDFAGTDDVHGSLARLIRMVAGRGLPMVQYCQPSMSK
jgi:hypothetical protein